MKTFIFFKILMCVGEGGVLISYLLRYLDESQEYSYQYIFNIPLKKCITNITTFKSLFLPRVAEFIYIEGDNKRVSSAGMINCIYNDLQHLIMQNPFTF